MRKTIILAFAFLVAGAILGTGAQGIYRAASSTVPMAIDPQLLAEFGDPSLSGVQIHYTATQGGYVVIQYMAPPMSKDRSPYPSFNLMADNVIEIDDEHHHVILDFNQGTVVLNGRQFVSRFPGRQSSVIRAEQTNIIKILGDGRIIVNGIKFVEDSSFGSDRAE